MATEPTATARFDAVDCVPTTTAFVPVAAVLVPIDIEFAPDALAPFLLADAPD